MIRIGITSGMSGYYAVSYDTVDGGLCPIQTGIGRYETAEEAYEEARDWARADGIALDPWEDPKEGK